MPSPADRASMTVVDHPLIQDKLTNMRKKETPMAVFRQLLREVTPLIAYEATRDLRMTTRRIRTTLAEMEAPVLADGPPVIVSVLRAGLAMAQALHELLPNAAEGHIGVYRDERTKRPVQYVVRLPRLAGSAVLIADPMLATGRTAAHAVDVLNQHGATDRDIRFLALVCAPEGVATLHAAHPEVRLFAAAVDSGLNDSAFIVPGLGDAGDRLFGTG